MHPELWIAWLFSLSIRGKQAHPYRTQQERGIHRPLETHQGKQLGKPQQIHPLLRRESTIVQ